MKHSILKNVLWVVGLLLAGSCINNDDIHDARGDKTVPLVPEDIVVKNIAGGAVVKYKLNHSASNIRYVKAEVKDAEGHTSYFHSSFGVDSVRIDGLLSTGKYQVKLYSVSYSEVASKALPVEVAPEAAPIETARITELRAAFSSVRVMYDNPAKEQLFIGLTKKINGHWQQMGMPYANQEKGSVYIQNQEVEEAEYGAYFYDKWGHRSEMKRRFETTKPSGNTDWKLSGELAADVAYANAGFHFLIPPEYETDIPGSQAVRYVRLYVHTTWETPLSSMRVAELSFWGIPVNQ